MDHALPVQFTRDGLARGARAMLPILPGAIAFGLLWGFMAGQRGLAPGEVLAMSAFVFAGAAQFLALELWTSPLPVAALVVTVLIVNLRHLMMGPVLAPWVSAMRPWQAALSLGVMTDESWGASVADLRRGGRDGAFLLGAGALLWAVWVPSTLLGRFAGDVGDTIEAFGLDYLTTAFFVVLLAAMWRGRGDLAPWLVAAGVALVSQAWLGGTWYIITGALAGSVLGAALELRRRRD